MSLDYLNAISNYLITEFQEPEPDHHYIRKIANDIFWSQAPDQVSKSLIANTDPNLTRALKAFRRHPQIRQSLRLDIEGILVRWKRCAYGLHDRMTPRQTGPGSHGLIVGDCWPNWRAMRLEAAHAHTQCGIHGKKVYGAYSVVVNGGYSNIDDSDGNHLWYWGIKSKDGTPTHPTNLLRKNLSTRNPVRVIRGTGAGLEWRPSRGFRYDGLYQVVEGEESESRPGNYLFRLERLQRQPDIQRNKPDNFTVVSWQENFF